MRLSPKRGKTRRCPAHHLHRDVVDYGTGGPEGTWRCVKLTAHNNMIILFRIAAALCFLAVGLGAFGAHALRSTLEARGMVDVWNKAVFYQFIHAVTLLVLALYGSINRGAWYLLFAGIVLFSGSLYLLALTNLRWLGAVTPVGGLCFLTGWACLVLAPPK